ncbi:MAG: protein adenylyltransferase SelO [Pseudohongiellaceae bacterium]
MNVAFNNTYIHLPEQLYSRQAPQPVVAPRLIRANRGLARLLGIEPDWLESAEGVAMVAGNLLPSGAEPIATVYAGHQFGSFNPQLGDGRAVLLGEVVGNDGVRYDIQLKGSGQTPYSRMGDGRAPLGPVLREYVVSEAMYALGVPTSRSLAAVTTGEPVRRQEALPGAVLARVARSHIRIGTAQFLAARGDREALHALVEHVINRHYPEAKQAEKPVQKMFELVCAAQASLVADWQALGFIHGVMNTDNMLLCGETIDYGPCAFMDSYHVDTVYSSIDHGGRYAYRKQPDIAYWNLACFAQALVPLLDDSEDKAIQLAKDSLDKFPAYFLAANSAKLQAKLGLRAQDEDEQLGKDFLNLLQATSSDFTLAFRRLSEIAANEPTENISNLFEFNDAFTPWLKRWRTRLGQQDRSSEAIQADMLAVNPALIPRNHLVEEAILAATKEDNFRPFHQLADALEHPFSYSQKLEHLAKPPRPEQVVTQTFCGT